MLTAVKNKITAKGELLTLVQVLHVFM